MKFIDVHCEADIDKVTENCPICNNRNSLRIWLRQIYCVATSSKNTHFSVFYILNPDRSLDFDGYIWVIDDIEFIQRYYPPRLSVFSNYKQIISESSIVVPYNDTTLENIQNFLMLK